MYAWPFFTIFRPGESFNYNLPELLQLLADLRIPDTSSDLGRYTSSYFGTFVGKLEESTLQVIHWNQLLSDGKCSITAISQNMISMVEWFLCTWCIDTNVSDSEKYTPLAHACSLGNLQIAELLLQHGCDVKNHGKNEMPPLQHACCSGCPAAPKLN